MDRQIVYLKADEIKPDPDQPRKRITEAMIESIATSIESVGLIKPIEIDEDNVIVTGEVRWRGAIKVGLEFIECIRWSGTLIERHTRQLIENLHHYKLESEERENGMHDLYIEINPDMIIKDGKPPSDEYRSKSITSLADILGISRQSLSQNIHAKEFRLQQLNRKPLAVSTRDISDTAGAEMSQRTKILEALASAKVDSKDIRDLKKIAQVSDELLEKVLEGEIPIERAKRTATTLTEVEERVAKERDETDFKISEKDKSKLIKKIAEDEHELDMYKETVLTRSVNAISVSEEDRPESVIQKPIGRVNPAEGLKKLVENLDLDKWKLKIRLMDVGEKKTAKRYLLQIIMNSNKLLKFMPGDE